MTEFIIDSDGSKRWYLNGILHQTNGPAIEYTDGTRAWWKHGQLHREDGPAIEWSGGSKKWFLHGKLHREDGPAIEWPCQNQYDWYLNGKLIAEGWQPQNWDELVLLAQIEKVMNE